MPSLSEMRADEWTEWTWWTESTRETAGFALQLFPGTPTSRKAPDWRSQERGRLLCPLRRLSSLRPLFPRARSLAPLLPQHELGDLHGVKGGSL